MPAYFPFLHCLQPLLLPTANSGLRCDVGDMPESDAAQLLAGDTTGLLHVFSSCQCVVKVCTVMQIDGCSSPRTWEDDGGGVCTLIFITDV